MIIAIVVPSNDHVHADFAMCLTLLYADVVRLGHQPVLINPRSSLVQKGRYDGVCEALAIKADKILFIDSDQTFPHYAFSMLLQRNKKIVGATCLTRRPPHHYTARDGFGKLIDFSRRQGLHRVATNGFPLCLIDAEVFHKVPKPWFNVDFAAEHWVGEDESFCKAAERAGYKIWVDADLTKMVGHIGAKVFK